MSDINPSTRHSARLAEPAAASASGVAAASPAQSSPKPPTSKPAKKKKKKTESISIGREKRIRMERDYYDSYPHGTTDRAERSAAIDRIAQGLGITRFQVEKNMGEITRRLGKVNFGESVFELMGPWSLLKD